MTEKNDLVYIRHILDSIGAIAGFSKGIDKEELASNRMKQSAIVREIEIIGEAAKNVSEDTKKRFEGVKWKEIAGTRDKMNHHYFGVDPDIVLAIIKKDLPELKKEMLEIEKYLVDK